MTKNIWDENWEKNTALDIHPELISLIKRYSPGKKILEIGFGTCGDLLELKSLGYDCYGLEKSEVAYKTAKKNKSLKIFLGDGEKSQFKNKQFDSIFHQGLLEHFKNPEKFVLEHKRLLKNNGIVVIDVPHKWNVFTLYKKYFQFLGKWYGGWERSYSSTELSQLLEKNGFKTLKITYRGIFPHQWGKFLFPKKISTKNKFKSIITKTPIKFAQKFTRFIYDKSYLIRIISSYNIIIVAKKL